MQAAEPATSYGYQVPPTYYTPNGTPCAPPLYPQPQAQPQPTYSFVPPDCVGHPAPTATADNPLNNVIQVVSADMMAAQQALLQRNAEMNTNIAALDGTVKKLKQKQLRENTVLTNTTYQKIAQWMNTNQWMVWSGLALGGFAYLVAGKKLQMHMPEIPIKIIGSVSLDGKVITVKRSY